MIIGTVNAGTFRKNIHELTTRYFDALFLVPGCSAKAFLFFELSAVVREEIWGDWLGQINHPSDSVKE